MKSEKLYQRKLVAFVVEKNKLLEEGLKKRKIKRIKGIKPYIIKKDLNFIMKIEDKLAKSIWNKIVYYIKHNKLTTGLYTDTCVFCYEANIDKLQNDDAIVENCDNCFYAKNHGNCMEDEGSTWDFFDTKIDHTEVLSNTVYKGIIKEINRSVK